MTIVKMAVGRQYPQMFHFIMKIVLFNNTENIDEVFSLYNKYGFDFQQIYQDIFTKNIDYSKFRDQAAIPDTINIVRWSLEKYGEENLLAIGKGALDFDKVEADLARYVDIMKKAFYVQS
jgi:hypothetical protein